VSAQNIEIQKSLYIETVVESLAIDIEWAFPCQDLQVYGVYCGTDRSEFSRLNHFGGSMTLNKDT